MKKDDLFQGAIVLARKYAFKKRTRCKIIEVGRSHSMVQNQRGYKFVTEQKDLRPAKITRKSLIGLGFKEVATYCAMHGTRTSSDGKPYCLLYRYAGSKDFDITLKGDCSFWDHNMILGNYGTGEISYIHEIQRIINQ